MKTLRIGNEAQGNTGENLVQAVTDQLSRNELKQISRPEILDISGRIVQLRRKREDVQSGRQVVDGVICAGVFGLLSFLGARFLLGLDPSLSMFACLVGLSTGGFVAVSLSGRQSTAQIDLELSHLDSRLFASLKPEGTALERAMKSFSLHQVELHRYYDQALVQSKGVFSLANRCLVLGVGLFVVSLCIVAQGGHDSIAAVVLSSTAGLAVNFIGFYALNVFKSNSEALLTLHSRFAQTHNAHFTNLLVSQVKDDSFRDEGLVMLALALAKGEVPKSFYTQTQTSRGNDGSLPLNQGSSPASPNQGLSQFSPVGKLEAPSVQKKLESNPPSSKSTDDAHF